MPLAPVRTPDARDGDLVTAMAGGDSAALAALYDRHCRVVMALCLRIVGSRQEAEETVGDVFWQIWQQAGRFDAGRGTVLGWILSLARSRAIDRWRAMRARGAGAVDSIEEPAVSAMVQAAGPGGGGTASADDPFGAAALAQRAGAVRAAVGALDPAQRQAVEMAFYNGLTHTEISEALGLPLGTVKTRIRQGLLKLRDALAEEFERGAMA